MKKYLGEIKKTSTIVYATKLLVKNVKVKLIQAKLHKAVTYQCFSGTRNLKIL